jgi:hypothetical protein
LVCLSACTSDAAGSTAVQIDRNTITSAEVVHWMSIIAAGASTGPGQPTPRPPDPPGYTACIAYLRKYAAWTKPVAGPPVPSAKLRSQCEYEYEKLKLKALYVAISFVWVDREARELGVRSTSADLQRELASFKRAFPSASAYKQFVGVRGLTLQDLLDELNQGLLARMIQRKLEAASAKRGLTTAQRQEALNRFSQAYVAKWRSRTNCGPKYLVPICRQYHLAKVPFGLVPNALPLTDLTAE